MNTLPDPPVQGSNPFPPVQGGPGMGAKEREAIGGAVEFPVTSGQEVELPKEVTSVGVSARPENIPIPQSVTQLGVQPLGQNVPVESTQGTITLPITDTEIAQGLRQDPTTSWRFLAEWCKRRLKKFGLWRK